MMHFPAVINLLGPWKDIAPDLKVIGLRAARHGSIWEWDWLETEHANESSEI